MSFPNRTAFSGALLVQPTARRSDAWNSAVRSAWSNPTVAPRPQATTQVRRPFSKGSPEARSVVRDNAARTSATRVGRTGTS
jgi:hypothetical protein